MAIIRGGIKVRPNVQAFCDALQAEIPEANSFGTYNGHSPPEGPTQAVDIFNPNNAAGHALQDRICDFAKRNAKRYGVRYCIRRRQIWNIERDAEGWRNQAYTGNPTVDHMDHTHITFYANGDILPTDPPPIIPISEGEIPMHTLIYQWSGQDWIFCPVSKTHGRLPFGDLLTALIQRKGVVNYGAQSSNFHAGITAWANAAHFAEIYHDDREN